MNKTMLRRAWWVGALLALVAAGCGADQEAADGVPSGSVSGSASSGSTADGRASETRGPPSLVFTEISAEAGLTAKNVSGDPVEKLAIVENIGQGAAWLDLENDGDLDLFIANGDVLPGTPEQGDARSRLYRNEGDFRFTDITAEAGVGFRGWAHGAYTVDFDADGFSDLYVTCYGRENLFFRNRGDGTLEDATARFGGADGGPSTAAAFFDADGDGDLDLYVGNYVDYDPQNPPNGGRPCKWKDLDVSCGPRGTPQALDRFYANEDGRLVEATERYGFNRPANYTLGVVAADFDNDGDTDVYVANDSTVNYHFENLGGGRFRDEAGMLGSGESAQGHMQAGMGVDAGDFDDDGRIDYYVTHFSHDYNTLYRNVATPDGSAIFLDETERHRLVHPTRPFLSWGTVFADLNNDGWRDLIVASGHVYPQVDGAPVDTTYRQRNQIFLSEGAREGGGPILFEEWMPPAKDGMAKEAVSRGLAPADLDNDGDLDLLFIELDATPTLLRNDSTNLGAWIGFHLQGRGANRDAIGARLELTASDGRTRHDQRTHGESYFSTPDPRLLFGLGSARGAATLVVHWPDGSRSEHRFEAEGLGRYHRVLQPQR